MPFEHMHYVCHFHLYTCILWMLDLTWCTGQVAPFWLKHLLSSPLVHVQKALCVSGVATSRHFSFPWRLWYMKCERRAVVIVVMIRHSTACFLIVSFHLRQPFALPCNRIVLFNQLNWLPCSRCALIDHLPV
jgi:hypothetical protein